MKDFMKNLPASPSLVADFKIEWRHFSELFKCVRAQPKPKYVHDLRTSSRRLEAYLSIFKTLLPGLKVSPLKAKLKRCRSRLSSLRDYDADLEILREQAAKPPRWVILSLLRERKTEENKIHRYFKSVSFKKQKRWSKTLIARLGNGPVSEAAAIGKLLQETEEDILESFRKSLHKARIKAKRLRYQTEILQKVGYSSRVNVEQLKTLQETLGALQNTRVLLEVLKKRRPKKYQQQYQELEATLLAQQKELTQNSQNAFLQINLP